MADSSTTKRQLQIKIGVVKRCVHSFPTRPEPDLTLARRSLFPSSHLLLNTDLQSSDFPSFNMVSRRRLAKEESSYLTEAQQQEARIQKFIDDGRDEYDLKQQVRPSPSLSLLSLPTPEPD